MAKRSRFNHVVRLDDDRVLVFNSLNTTVAILTNSDYTDYCTASSFEYDHPRWSALFDSGILVPDDLDELSIVNFDRAHALFRPREAYFRILTTTECNARCDYCYERGTRLETMTRSTAEGVIDFIVRQSEGLPRISISWFGGEPLLNHSVISYITSRLDSIPETADKEKHYSMISNGSLFSPNLIRSARTEWHLESVQITLDGLPAQYAEIKRYRDDSTFDRVVRNIRDLHEAGIRVSIRLNYDGSNSHDIESLIAYLGNNFADADGISVYCYPIFSPGLDYCSLTDSCSLPLSRSIERAGLMATGFVSDLPSYRATGCYSCASGSFVIMPNGELAKCCRLISDKETFGSIYDSELQPNSNYTKWLDPCVPQRCTDCSLLPICQGGCRADQMAGKSGCTLSARVIDELLLEYARASSCQAGLVNSQRRLRTSSHDTRD